MVSSPLAVSTSSSEVDLLLLCVTQALPVLLPNKWCDFSSGGFSLVSCKTSSFLTEKLLVYITALSMSSCLCFPGVLGHLPKLPPPFLSIILFSFFPNH